MTDHYSLTKLFKQQHLSAFQVRLVNSIADIPNLKLIHRPGEDGRITIVDRLSRAHLDPALTKDFREMYTEWEESKVNLITRAVKLAARRTKARTICRERIQTFGRKGRVKIPISRKQSVG